jgi:hypothetical protein
MIKLLDDLLIAATCNPNVPGAIVAGLRQVLNEARAALPSPTLPPPFDSLEEARRPGLCPALPSQYLVCIREHAAFVGHTVPVGHVVELGAGESLLHPECWVACDAAGWVHESIAVPEHLTVERHLWLWRPVARRSALVDMAAQAATLKLTNPKDAAATGRVPLGLLSPIAKAHWALAQHCGRAKYGAWNWREAGARASIYLDAIGRHTDGYLSGETHDPTDGTHHLGNIMACCAILLEAEASGKLVDDRPPTLDMRATYADVEKRLADLTVKYADRNPKHWTITDRGAS